MWSLGNCYWSWGLLARHLKDQGVEREKLAAALALFTDLNMPRERDAVAAELSNFLLLARKRSQLLATPSSTSCLISLILRNCGGQFQTLF